MTKKIIKELNRQLTGKTAEEVISFFSVNYSGRIAFATSLGAEDQALTHMISDIDKNINIFTIDTGRLFPDTYDLLDRTCKKYKINIQVYFPDYAEVQKMVSEKGINLFYDSVENRKLCCAIRKIEPLQRALKGMEAWICGLRKEQAYTRIGADTVEWDEVNGLIKVNPLVTWSEQQVWHYIKMYKIPYNPLHDKNYPSIGCQPCTGPVEPGNDIRSGRWWWENPESKECGLHKK